MESKEAGGYRSTDDNSLPGIRQTRVDFIVPKGLKIVIDEDAEIDLNKIEEFLNAHMDKQVADVKLANLREDTAIEEFLEKSMKHHKEVEAENQAKVKAWKASSQDNAPPDPEA